MTRINRSALVAYSDRQMFDLVNDIEAYPQYMTGVKSVQILDRQADVIAAKLVLSKGPLNQSFATRNQLLAPSSMKMELLEGPFKSFSGNWSFKALSEDACKVTLELEFEFNNRLLAMAAGPMFEKVTAQQVEALCQRAEQVYG